MPNSNDRRSFVTCLTLGTAALATSTLLGRDLPAQPSQPAARAPERAAEEWDMSWVDRLTGRHKQVFDSPEISYGTALTQVRTWMRGYAAVYGTQPAEMNAVLVIRHSAVPMVLNDAFWDELELGKMLAEHGDDGEPKAGTMLKDPVTGEPARRNPFLSANAGKDAKYSMLGYPDAGFDALIADGVTVLACGLALGGFTQFIAQRDKVDNATADAKMRAGLIPGVIVMPSGIFATARAQEAGCTFMQA